MLVITNQAIYCFYEAHYDYHKIEQLENIKI